MPKPQIKPHLTYIQGAISIYLIRAIKLLTARYIAEFGNVCEAARKLSVHYRALLWTDKETGSSCHKIEVQCVTEFTMFCLIWTWKQFLCFFQNWWVTTEQLNSCFHVSAETDFHSAFGLLRTFYLTMASPLITSTLKNSWNVECFFPTHHTSKRTFTFSSYRDFMKDWGSSYRDFMKDWHPNTTSVSYWSKWCIFSQSP